MTSDYVDAVLFQLRWEAFEDLDGYFMGLYDKPESSDEHPTKPNAERDSTTSDRGTQTPEAWPSSGLAQAAKEAVPRAAPERFVTPRPGTNRPHPLVSPKIEPWRTPRLTGVLPSARPCTLQLHV